MLSLFVYVTIYCINSIALYRSSCLKKLVLSAVPPSDKPLVIKSGIVATLRR